MNFYYYCWTFIISSIFGWIVEVLFAYIKTKKFQNRSSLIYGTWGLAYGIGATILNLLLKNYETSNIFIIFLVSFIGCTVVEYIMSFGMQLVCGFCVWDYKKKKFNINGRVCLQYSLYWGILGIIWIKFINKTLRYIIGLIPVNIGLILLRVIIVYLIFDIIISILAVSRYKRRQKDIKPNNFIEIYLDKRYNNKFLKKVYPQMFEYKK